MRLTDADLDSKLKLAVADLPELYQEVYGHSEFASSSARVSSERLAQVVKVYKALSTKKKRELRVLDLGCAQGYFSFQLAALGADVIGVDFLEANLKLCELIAIGNADFKVRFVQDTVERYLENTDLSQFDLVLGLSVFHHVLKYSGEEKTQALLQKLADSVDVALFEFAVKEEPMSWAALLPTTPTWFLQSYEYFYLLTRQSTHLSTIKRPMFLASNKYLYCCDEFKKIDIVLFQSHQHNQDVYQKSRKYFLAEDIFAKVYNLENVNLVSQNTKDYSSELLINRVNDPTLRPSQVITSFKNVYQAAIFKKRLKGKLLSEIIITGVDYDPVCIYREVLEQLVVLEKHNLYHSDVRPWNVFVCSDGAARLIDFGSLVSEQVDCAWPSNIFTSFLIFMNEVFLRQISEPLPVRLFLFDLKAVPVKYLRAFDLLLQNQGKLSFKQLYELSFINKHDDLISQHMHLHEQLAQSFNHYVLDVNKKIQSNNKLIEKQQQLDKKIHQLNEKNNSLKKALSVEKKSALKRQAQFESEIEGFRDELQKNNKEILQLQAAINAVVSTKIWRIAEKVRKLANLGKRLIQVLDRSNKTISHPAVNLNSNKILYIGHSYHEKTGSTKFLIDLLKENFEVDVVGNESWRGGGTPDYSSIDNSYRAVIFFQILPTIEQLKKINHPNIIFIPMYDYSGGWSYDKWISLAPHLRVINFSKTLEKQISSSGIVSLPVQYFPNPSPKIIPGNKSQVFFWQRINSINLSTVAKLLNKMHSVSLHVHEAIDPGNNKPDYSQLTCNITKLTKSNWYKTRAMMHEQMKKAEIYIAPREYEGIGQSFLEAMAMGKIVVAADRPTMNEYIEHGVTGYLFNPNDAKAINFTDLKNVQRNAYRYCNIGYKQWCKQKQQIIEFILSPHAQ